MSERIITLFGEEIVPEQLKAVGRSRAKKKNEGKEESIDDEATTADITIENEPISHLEGVTETTPSIAATEPVTASTGLAEVNSGTVEIVNENQAQGSSQEIADENPAEETEDPADTKVPKKERAVLANLPDDWQGDKKYYSIGEVAEIFKVKTSHIRFWTNEFKLKVRTTRKGDRLYTPEQIREIKTINNLVKERGFTIKGAKTRLKAPEKMEVETVDLKQSLLQLRNKLVAIKNQLK